MKNLLVALKWDFRLIGKYGIATVALAIAVIYCSILLFFNTKGFEKLISVFIFSDPVMYGFLFTAIMILFEKDAHIHEALAITPAPASRYILSKTIAFTVCGICF